MKTFAKWVAIIWSVFCLLGVIVGMGNVGKSLDSSGSDAAQAGAALGIGCGMAMWLTVWAVIAGPAFLVYLLAGKKSDITLTTAVAESQRTAAKLCRECGKYYDGTPSFCPNCGKSIQMAP